MRNSVKRILALALAIMMLATLFTGCSSASKKEDIVIKIGCTPGEDVQKAKDSYKTMQDYIEKMTGYKTELFIATDYASVIEAMRSGEVDIANFGPLSYVLAKDVANAEVFATDYKASTGKFYIAYLITRPDSGIESIEDLKGKSFSYVDPASTGGYLIPYKEMKENGVDPDKDLASTIFAGGHDGSALAVINGTVDAGAIVKHQYEKFLEKELFSEDDVKIFHVSEPFPSGAWALRPDLDEDAKTALKDCILNIPESEMENLKPFMGSTEKYEPAVDSDWDPLRAAAELAGVDLANQ